MSKGIDPARSEKRSFDILVVDDEVLILSLIEQVLTGHGHHVRTACDGVAGLEQMRTEPADIVISDIRMPKMDGLAMGKLMREEFPDTPIILITGYFSEYSQGCADEIGITQIVRKPFKSAQLVEIVDRLAAQIPE